MFAPQKVHGRGRDDDVSARPEDTLTFLYTLEIVADVFEHIEVSDKIERSVCERQSPCVACNKWCRDTAARDRQRRHRDVHTDRLGKLEPDLAERRTAAASDVEIRARFGKVGHIFPDQRAYETTAGYKPPVPRLKFRQLPVFGFIHPVFGSQLSAFLFGGSSRMSLSKRHFLLSVLPTIPYLRQAVARFKFELRRFALSCAWGGRCSVESGVPIGERRKKMYST